MAYTRNFADVIRAQMAADPELADGIEVESLNADIAMMVYDARTRARLTQRQLANRVGTQQSVISRIEDADYEGHSLALLNRIAKALGKTLKIEFQRSARTRRPKPAARSKRAANR
jgi:transcriptional regulator with XRE-family HTH domain